MVIGKKLLERNKASRPGPLEEPHTPGHAGAGAACAAPPRPPALGHEGAQPPQDGGRPMARPAGPDREVRAPRPGGRHLHVPDRQRRRARRMPGSGARPAAGGGPRPGPGGAARPRARGTPHARHRLAGSLLQAPAAARGASPVGLRDRSRAPPEVAVETGILDGLGSRSMLRALQRNAEVGRDGRLWSFDIMPGAGALVPDRLAGRWTPLYEDTEEGLPAATGRALAGLLHPRLRARAGAPAARARDRPRRRPAGHGGDDGARLERRAEGARGRARADLRGVPRAPARPLLRGAAPGLGTGRAGPRLPSGPCPPAIRER